MSELLTAAQMRAIEQAAIDSGEVTGLELMERAGRGVVDAVFEEWPGLAKTSHRAVVLCGPGNNGGDGFVVARLLKEWGLEVEVFLYGDAEKLPPDARVNYERWAERTIPLNNEIMKQRPFHSDLVVDAIFGTGLSRAVELPLSILQELTAKGHVPNIVSVDLPSGICSDSGKILGERDHVVKSDLTITFEYQKMGHVLSDGPEFCGNVRCQTIGLNHRQAMKALGWSGTDPVARRNYGRGVVKMPTEELFRPEFLGCKIGLSILDKDIEDHKFSHGHALVLTGGPGKTGAARLSARGALRIGAGVVTLGVPPSAQMEVAGHITAVMLTRVADGDALGEVLQDTRINALCLGPGLGLERARELVPVALDGVEPRPTVLDADALGAYGDDPEVLFAMLHDACVLTPHGGEFARLFPDIAARLGEVATSGPAYSKVDATREAAKRAGCVVLFKGPDTVIAAPDGRCSINSAHYERAAPWLATAGSGDVLAGFITGLLARGFAPMQAAETAAWLHVECAREFGPGLIAEDIPEILPKVFRKLGL